MANHDLQRTARKACADLAPCEVPCLRHIEFGLANNGVEAWKHLEAVRSARRLLHAASCDFSQHQLDTLMNCKLKMVGFCWKKSPEALSNLFSSISEIVWDIAAKNTAGVAISQEAVLTRPPAGRGTQVRPHVVYNRCQIQT